jgi:PKD repeat protein
MKILLAALAVLLLVPAASALTITANPTAPSAGNAVAFTTDGGSATVWSFDDGGPTATGASVQHTYHYAGVYYVSATVAGQTKPMRLVVGYPAASVIAGNATTNTTSQTSSPSTHSGGSGGGFFSSGTGIILMMFGGVGGFLGLFAAGKKYTEKRRNTFVSKHYEDDEDGKPAESKDGASEATKEDKTVKKVRLATDDADEPPTSKDTPAPAAPASPRRSVIDDEDDDGPVALPPHEARELASAARSATSFSGPSGPAVDIRDLASGEAEASPVEDETPQAAEPKRARANLASLGLSDTPLETVDPTKSGKGLE